MPNLKTAPAVSLRPQHARPAFSLIEILISVVIIAILATAAVVAFGTTRVKARDSKRINDVKEIQSALELYFGEEHRYPDALALGGPLVGPSSGTTFMAKMPSQTMPADGSCTNGKYDYVHLAGSKSYAISFCLGAAGNEVGSAGEQVLTGNGFEVGSVGTYLDAPVTGLDYNSPAFSGVTYGGKFAYKKGETTVYRFGKYVLGSIYNNNISTDQTVFVPETVGLARTEISSQKALVVSHFLLSLNTSNDPAVIILDVTKKPLASSSINLANYDRARLDSSILAASGGQLKAGISPVTDEAILAMLGSTLAGIGNGTYPEGIASGGSNEAATSFTLTYTAGSGGSITGISTQTVDSGTSGTEVVAIPDIGYTFASWSDGVLTAARTDLNVAADLAVTANFNAPNVYTLSYTAAAGGTITGSLTQSVVSGSSGSLVTAVAETGYNFTTWSDGVTSASRTDSSVQANVTVIANFIHDNYILNYTAGSGGSISGSMAQSVVPGGSGSQVTAVPDASHSFSSWSDGVLTASRTDSSVVANLSVSASFVLRVYTLAYSASTGGAVSGSILQTVNHGSNGSQVTAVAGNGYTFSGWSDGVNTASRTDLAVNSDHILTANFSPIGYTLAYTAGSGGSISGSSTQSVVYGANGSTVTAVPDASHNFASWSDGGGSASRTDNVITGDISATATFTLKTYVLNYAAGTGGTLSGTSTQTVDYGSSGSTVTAVPNTDYVFSGWSDNVATAARTDATVVANLSVTANFVPDTTYGNGADGAITVASTKNIYTDAIASGRTCADAIGYAVTAVGSNYATAAATPAAGCLAVGDEVLLINLQGANASNLANVGHYETFRITSVSGATIYFSPNKTLSYGNNGGDANIGISGATNKVNIYRIPNYTDVTINNGADLTSTAWGGVGNGVLAFKAKGTLTVNGRINMSARGFSGGATESCGEGQDFESNRYHLGTYPIGGGGWAMRNNGNGGCSANTGGGGGGGAGYGASGSNGTKGFAYQAGSPPAGFNSGSGLGYAGGTYGAANLTVLNFGAGGGGGGYGACGGAGGTGGTGGGIIYIFAKNLTLNNANAIYNVGGQGECSAGGGAGGAGAGGSVYLKVKTANIGTNMIQANGGATKTLCGWSPDAWAGNGGAGGAGRVAIYYKNSVTGSANSPTPSQYSF